MLLTPKLIVSALVLVGLSSLGVAAYAAPNLAPSVGHTLIAQISGTGQADSGGTSANGTGDSEAGTEIDSSGAITATETLTGSLKIATAIADHFNVPVTDVTQLHAGGWGYGEIYKLYSYAAASGKSVAEIEAMFNSGMGWGEIARALNLPPGNAGDNLGSIIGQSNRNPSVPSVSGPGSGNGKVPPGKGEGQGHGKGNGK